MDYTYEYPCGYIGIDIPHCILPKELSEKFRILAFLLFWRGIEPSASNLYMKPRAERGTSRLSYFLWLRGKVAGTFYVLETIGILTRAGVPLDVIYPAPIESTCFLKH